MTLRAEPLIRYRCELGEAALWHPERKLFLQVDITGKKLFTYDIQTGTHRIIGLDSMPGTIVPRASGGVVAALQNGIAALDLDTEELTWLADIESDNPRTRFNDGKADARGRLWAGTYGIGPDKPDGTLYRIDRDLTVTPMISGVKTSNGIVWTKDNITMYYVDSPLHTIDAFDFDLEKGTISRRRTVVRIPSSFGVADGMWIDIEDNLWVAHWGGGCVRRWDPNTGRLLETIDVPGAKNVTSCAFGGPNLDLLYITTASQGTDPETIRLFPNAGYTFIARPGVRGVEAHAFGG